MVIQEVSKWLFLCLLFVACHQANEDDATVISPFISISEASCKVITQIIKIDLQQVIFFKHRTRPITNTVITSSSIDNLSQRHSHHKLLGCGFAEKSAGSKCRVFVYFDKRKHRSNCGKTCSQGEGVLAGEQTGPWGESPQQRQGVHTSGTQEKPRPGREWSELESRDRMEVSGNKQSTGNLPILPWQFIWRTGDPWKGEGSLSRALMTRSGAGVEPGGAGAYALLIMQNKYKWWILSCTLGWPTITLIQDLFKRKTLPYPELQNPVSTALPPHKHFTQFF